MRMYFHINGLKTSGYTTVTYQDFGMLSDKIMNWKLNPPVFYAFTFHVFHEWIFIQTNRFFFTLRGHIKTAFKTFTHAFILYFSYTTFNMLFVYSCFTFVPNPYHKYENPSFKYE